MVELLDAITLWDVARVVFGTAIVVTYLKAIQDVYAESGLAAAIALAIGPFAFFGGGLVMIRGEGPIALLSPVQRGFLWLAAMMGLSLLTTHLSRRGAKSRKRA